DISAGSNQVGASETWTPQASWPCGLAAGAAPELAAIATAAMAARRCRRSNAVRWPNPLGTAGTAPACVVAMAFPFNLRAERFANLHVHPHRRRRGRSHSMRDGPLFVAGNGGYRSGLRQLIAFGRPRPGPNACEWAPTFVVLVCKVDRSAK